MYEIVIKLPQRPETVGKLVVGNYRIGSSPAAHIQINRPDVSARHALLSVKKDGCFVQDAGSKNGTYLNGKRVGEEPTTVPSDSLIQVGESTIRVRNSKDVAKAVQAANAGQAAPEKSGSGSAAASAPASQPAAQQAPASTEGRNIELLALSGIPYEMRQEIQKIKRKVHEDLLTRVNLKSLTLSSADYEQTRSQAQQTIHAILVELQSKLPKGLDANILEKELIDEAVALGPLEGLLANPAVTEIMVNGCDNVYCEQSGRLYRTDMMFADDNQLLTTIERIVAPLGRRIDESQPLVDARLQDGSRVNAIIPPLAIDGPSLTIRKFSKKPLTIQNLIDYNSITQPAAELLRLSVVIRKNILISGGTGSGKTTLLNVVSNYIPNDERIVTIEDAAELRLSKDHIVRLEARPPNIEGRGAVTIRDLVRNSLRMRPDRIVIGECRGGEALDMLQAMNTGHDGSLTTIHANTPRDALARLETLVLMAGFDLPLRAIREQIASAISMIVQIGRLSDGSRKVLEVAEVTGMEGDVITTQEIFQFDQKGIDDNAKIIGKLCARGVIPTFTQELQQRGLAFDIGMFTEDDDDE
jgi:pilus assembly protein CpaF